MAGQMTLGGKSEGPAGQIGIGPMTVTGTTALSESETLELASGDNTITVPKGAVSAALFFTTIEGPEVKLRTNLNLAEAGLPILGQRFAVIPLTCATTSLILHAASTTTVGVTFI